MPMLEVIMTDLDRTPADAKRAFAAEVADVFRDVLGTPRDRLQLVLVDLPPDCSSHGLLAEDDSL